MTDYSFGPESDHERDALLLTYVKYTRMLGAMGTQIESAQSERLRDAMDSVWQRMSADARELSAYFSFIDKSDPLSFAALRAANERRLPQFKNRHGGPAHAEPDGSDWSDAEWLQAVVGELGEYANVRKKLQRGDLTREEALPLMRDELADMVCYMDLLAFRLGIDLGEAVRDKFNRVSERVGSDVKL